MQIVDDTNGSFAMTIFMVSLNSLCGQINGDLK